LYVGLKSLAGECLGGYVDYIGKTGAEWDKSNYLKYFNSDVLTLKSCQNPCTSGVWADGQGIAEDGSAEPLIMISKWINSANKDRKLVQAFNMRLVMGGEEVIYLENALSPGTEPANQVISGIIKPGMSEFTKIQTIQNYNK
jgi:hypothetical protein